MKDKELLELAAKAAGFEFSWDTQPLVRCHEPEHPKKTHNIWNPLEDDGDRYRLAQKLGFAIDFKECTVWKRVEVEGLLIQEYWGGDHGDEAHAIVRAAAEIGKGMQ